MDFFKKLFSREPEEITLKHIELKEWLQENSEKALSEENKILKEYVSDIRDLKIELKEKLDILQKAELLNQNIPEREKHIMEGNRATYLTKMYSFIKDIKEPEFDYAIIESFCSDMDKKIEELNQTTGKGYFILTNFFEKEIREVASSIKKIEENIIGIKDVFKQGKVAQYKELFLDIRELNESKIKSEKLMIEIENLENELKESESRKNSFEDKLKALKDSHEYLTYVNVEKEKKEIEDELIKLNSKLNNAIKPLDKNMKKLAHDSIKEETINSYLVAPLAALERDVDYELLFIAEKIRQDITKEESDDKDKQKTLKQIDNITKEFLDEIKKENERLKKEKETMHGILERSSIVMDLKEIEYQIDHISGKIKNLAKEIEVKKEQHDSLKSDNKTKKLEKTLSDFSGKKTTISD